MLNIDFPAWLPKKKNAKDLKEKNEPFTCGVAV
jgi:hypothetical protein